MATRPAQRFGRFVIDDAGMTQRRRLGLFGETFRIPWRELTGWWVVDQYLQQRAGGAEQVIRHVLGLECAGALHVVTRPAGDESFARLVTELRQRAASKERPGSESPLAAPGRSRR